MPAMPGMTVKQVIAALKKMPQDAKIGWQDGDHHKEEIGGVLFSVAEASVEQKELHGVGVVLRG